MVGSAQSISGPNVALNTAVAEALDEIATRLEKAKDKNREIVAIIRDAVNEHGRIIFNGNNYSAEWVKEAKKRGLPNVGNTVDALASRSSPRRPVKLFAKYQVFSKEELHSRYEIYLEQFAKHLNIEALTAIQMTRRQYIPAVITFMTELGSSIDRCGKHTSVQKEILAEVGTLLESAYRKVNPWRRRPPGPGPPTGSRSQAAAFRDRVRPLPGRRSGTDIDALEELTPADLWPVPTYADLLFRL